MPFKHVGKCIKYGLTKVVNHKELCKRCNNEGRTDI